jgi:hypothetical protein
MASKQKTPACFFKTAIIFICFSITCTKPPPMVFPGNVPVTDVPNLALGIILLPDLPYIVEPAIIQRTFGQGPAPQLFLGYFKSTFKTLLFSKTVFQKIEYLNDSIPVKKKILWYGKSKYLELKLPAASLSSLFDRGIHYVMMIENFTVMPDYKSLKSVMLYSVSQSHGIPRSVAVIQSENQQNKCTSTRLLFSAKIALMNCKNDSVTGYGDVTITNSAVDFSRSDWYDCINDMVQIIFEQSKLNTD